MKKTNFILATLSGLSVIVSYDWIRSASTPLFVTHYSKDLIPFASALMVASMIFVLFFYNKLLTKIGPRYTFLVTSLGSTFSFITLYFLLKTGVKEAAFAIYIFRYIYVMLLIEQIWSFFNTVHKKKEARVLSGPMMGIISLGSTLSGQFLGKTASEIGSLNVVLISGLMLIPSAIIMFIALKDVEIEKNKEEKTGFNIGASYLKNRPVLISLFFVVLLSQIYAATTTFRFEMGVSSSLMSIDQQTAFYANFYSKVNFFAAIMQFIATPLLLSNFALGYIHMFIPLIHLSLSLFVILTGNLASIALALSAFKVIDYSVYKGAKEMIYIPFSKTIKYRAKQFIDVFGYRFGTGFIALSFALVKLSDLKIPEKTYTWVAFIMSICWLLAAIQIHLKLKRSQKSK